MSAYLLTHIFEKDNSHRNTELSRRGQLKLLTKRKAQKVKSRCLSSKQMRTSLEISEQKIEKELDVVNFVRQAKFVKVILCALFNKTERFLIRKNQRLAINGDIKNELTSFGSDSSFDATQAKIETSRERCLLK